MFCLVKTGETMNFELNKTEEYECIIWSTRQKLKISWRITLMLAINSVGIKIEVVGPEQLGHTIENILNKLQRID